MTVLLYVLLFWQPPLVWILLRQKLRQRLMLKMTILSTSRPSILGFNSTNGGGFMPSLFSCGVPRDTIGKKKSLVNSLGWKKNENVWKSHGCIMIHPRLFHTLSQCVIKPTAIKERGWTFFLFSDFLCFWLYWRLLNLYRHLVSD